MMYHIASVTVLWRNENLTTSGLHTTMFCEVSETFHFLSDQTNLLTWLYSSTQETKINVIKYLKTNNKKKLTTEQTGIC